MVILKTIIGNLSANVNEITFTDNIIDSNSIIEVYYNSNDIYTVETWQREHTIGIVTSDHDFPVSVKVLINNVVAFEPYDDSQVLSQLSDLDGRVTDAEDAISGLATRVGDAEDDIDALEDAVSNLNTSKQDVLTAGDNITIENNIISASGGSGVDYSLTEQNTGLKWIDNKPIYQKTFSITSGWTLGSWVSVLNLTSSNIDTLIESPFTYYRETKNLQYTGNGSVRPESNVNNYGISVRYYNYNLDLLVIGYTDLSEIVITLLYTKTTD